MRLADFIIDQTEAILQEWEGFAHTMNPAALTMTSKELRNHAAVMLKVIADDLRTPQTPEEQAQNRAEAVHEQEKTEQVSNMALRDWSRVLR